MKALLCELLFTCLLAAPGARSVDEIAYGSMLYAYFQADQSGALVAVMVAEKRGHLGTDPARFHLATGSLAFAEGLNTLSDAALARLEGGKLADLDRMRLAFHRARAQHRDGDWAAMAASLDTIRFDRGFFGQQYEHPEIAFMRAEGALASGDFARAGQALAHLNATEDYLGYGLFNLAVAQRATGDIQGARAALEQLAALRLDSTAGRDLVARGRLGLAHAARESGDPISAQAVLDRLPGAGRYRDQALALYGDLAMRREDYTLAARIWLRLQEDPQWHGGRAAAELGLPMAFEGLASTAQALDAYQRAAERFGSRLAALQTLTANLDRTGWPGQLLETHANAGPGTPIPTPPEVAETLGSSAWLAWLAQDDVHRLLGEWRELQSMQGWLDGLPPHLAALEEVKGERRRRSTAARSQLAEQALEVRRDQLIVQIDDLEARIAALSEPQRALDDDLVGALGDPRELALLQRLDRLGDRLASMPTDSERAAVAARIDRLRGVLIWQVANTRDARVRALVKELDGVRALLTDIDARITRLSLAETRLAAGVEADFQEFATRADQLASSVATSLTRREEALAVAFREAVEAEQRRVEQYLLTVRVAIARTSDQLAATTPPGKPGT